MTSPGLFLGTFWRLFRYEFGFSRLELRNIFELSGAYQYCETGGGTFLCCVASQDRTWRAFREPNPGFR